MHKYLFKSLLAILLSIYPAVEFLGNMVAGFNFFWGTAILVCTVTKTTLHSHQQCTKVPIFPYPADMLFSLLFRMRSHPSSVRWYLTVASICIPLLISDEHLLVCLLAICMSSLEKCLSKSLAHFLIKLFIFLPLSCRNSFYVYSGY